MRTLLRMPLRLRGRPTDAPHRRCRTACAAIRLWSSRLCAQNAPLRRARPGRTRPSPAHARSWRDLEVFQHLVEAALRAGGAGRMREDVLPVGLDAGNDHTRRIFRLTPAEPRQALDLAHLLGAGAHPRRLADLAAYRA